MGYLLNVAATCLLKSVCSKPVVILCGAIVIVMVVLGANLVGSCCTGAILQSNLPFFPLGEDWYQWVDIRRKYRADL